MPCNQAGIFRNNNILSSAFYGFVGVVLWFLTSPVAFAENVFVNLTPTGGLEQVDGNAFGENYTLRFGTFVLDADTQAADIATLLTGPNAVANVTNGANFLTFGTLAWSDRDDADALSFNFDAVPVLNRDIYLLVFNEAAGNLAASTQLGVFRFFLDGTTPATFEDRTLSGDKDINLAVLTESDSQDPFVVSFFGSLRFNNELNTTAILGNSSSGLGVTSGTPPDGVQGAAYAGYTITANNGATSFSASGLPAGLSVNAATGEISGTPTEAGAFNVTLTASNPRFTNVSKPVTLTVTAAVGQPPLVTNPGPQTLVRTASFSLDISATESPTSYNLQGAPAGLTINAQGQIRGTTTAAAGSYDVTVTASNAGGSDQKTFTLTLTNPTVSPSSPNLNVPINAVIPNITMTISAGTAATFSASLPTGLAINPANGTISGTPTTVGTSTTVVTADFGAGITATAEINFNFTSPAPSLLALGAGEGELTRNASVSLALEIDPGVGSVGPYTFSVVGTLPPGLSLNGEDGTLTGTSSTLGTYPVVFRVSNTGGTSPDLPFTFNVEVPAPQITSKLWVPAGVNTTFIYDTSSNDNHTYGAENLPAWATFSGGRISGRPTSPGTFLISLIATTTGRLGNPVEDRETLQITVAAGRPNPASFAFGDGQLRVGVPVWSTQAAEGFFLAGADQLDNSTTYFNATGLPPGLNFGRKWVDDPANPDPLVGTWYDQDAVYKSSARRRGMITGTPERAGTFPITVYIQNGYGFVKKNHTLTVLP